MGINDENENINGNAAFVVTFLNDYLVWASTILNNHLEWYSTEDKATGARHAFQVVLESEYEERDCFASTEPTVVSGKTFLSQLV